MINSEDFSVISEKTRRRTLERVSKAGYMDGAVDGQTSVFQKSFDFGYEQGVQFGIELGKYDAINSGNDKPTPWDSGQLHNNNCQICGIKDMSEQNILSLYENQKHKNDIYLNKIKL